ncbi:MAG TPA: maleylacetoacetate isomerase [Paracoccaceae bacterium]|nr:maleylacetoacetate isomerase [Paracoccaceae bacterium]
MAGDEGVAMIVLHDYWRSSAAWRVRIGLGLLGLAWESRPVDLLAGGQRGTANLSRNPQGLVPTVEVDGLVLTQSLAILEYLDETRGPVLLPSDAPGRARVRRLAHAIAMEIAPVANLRVRQRVAAISGGAMTEWDWVREVVAPGLDAVEAMLSDDPGPLCHGESPGLADACLVPQVYNARRVGLEPAGRWPRIAAIDAALSDHPAFAAAHPDRFAPNGATP